jgi:CRP-like cAMP-binding protein
MERATQKSKASSIEIDHVMPGADVIQVGDEQIALGFPEEVVKAWTGAGKKITAWLIPDVRCAPSGIVQWALEFPLYQALFVQGAFAQRRKVTVLVHERDWPDVVAYLRLTLLGLTRQEMEAVGVAPESAAALAAEGEHLALKHPDGRIAQVEDFLAPRFFDAEGVVEHAGLRIKSHGENTYSFFTEVDRLEEHRLDTDVEQVPPYARPLTPASTPVLPQPFEVITLGASHGFDANGPCSNLVVQANGRFFVVDCGPYIRATLQHAGLAINQISGVIITHAHEDHAVGLSALLGLTHRLSLFVTRETAAILRRKLAILNPTMSSPATLLDDTCDVVYVTPGEELDHLGLHLRFHYTMHSIPCTGVELSVRDAGVERRALIVGDNNSRVNIERAAREGVLSPARLDALHALYRWRGDLVIADAGAGMIHGEAGDFRDSPARNVIYVHSAALAEEERHLYTLAEPGHRYTLAAEHRRPGPLERGIAHKALVQAFAAVDGDWLNALLDEAEAESVNRGQVVVRQQDRTDDLFVVLTGELAVLAARDGHVARLAEIHAGEVFGEMAAINEAPRTATVIASTPARLLRVPGGTWRRFAWATELVPSLPDVWRKRADLERVGIFAAASVTTKNALARQAVRRTVAPGATLIREGSPSTTVYVLVQGRVQVYRASAPLLVGGAPVILDPGTLIGERAPFLQQPRNSSIVTLDECEVLAVRGADFKQIVQRSPQLLCRISQVVRQRQAA